MKFFAFFFFLTVCFLIAGGVAVDIYKYPFMGVGLWLCSFVSGFCCLLKSQIVFGE